MTLVSTKYYCQKCEKELKPDQKICPRCGSIHRMIKATIEEKIVVKETLKARQKRKGFKRFMREWIHGWFPSRNKRKFPEGIKKTRIIDKEKDEYHETVKDLKTGEIIHDCHEKLTDHKKHGED